MTSNHYIMDTSSLVELNRHIPIDVFPSVWNNLESLSKKGLLVAPAEVLSEVKERDNDLTSWARKNNSIFRPPSKKQIELLKDILKNYPALVKEGRKYDADLWGIDLAVEMKASYQQTIIEIKRIVVTEESGGNVKVTFTIFLQCIV